MERITKKFDYWKNYLPTNKIAIAQSQIPLYYFLVGVLFKKATLCHPSCLFNILRDCISLCTQQNMMSSQQFFQILRFLNQHPKKVFDFQQSYQKWDLVDLNTNKIQQRLDDFYQKYASSQWKQINKQRSKTQAVNINIFESKLKSCEKRINDSKPKTENTLIKNNLQLKEENKVKIYDNIWCDPSQVKNAQKNITYKWSDVFEEKTTISWCPNMNCTYCFQEKLKNPTYFQCPKCQRTFCLNCRSASHYGIECIANKIKLQKLQQVTFNNFLKNGIKKLDNSQYRKEFQQEKNKNYGIFTTAGFKYKQCPKCQFWAQLDYSYFSTTSATCSCHFCFYKFCIKCGKDRYQQCKCRIQTKYYQASQQEKKIKKQLFKQRQRKNNNVTSNLAFNRREQLFNSLQKPQTNQKEGDQQKITNNNRAIVNSVQNSFKADQKEKDQGKVTDNSKVMFQSVQNTNKVQQKYMGQQTILNNSNKRFSFNSFDHLSKTDQRQNVQQTIANNSSVITHSVQDTFKADQREKNQRNMTNNNKPMFNPFANSYLNQKQINNTSTNNNLSKKSQKSVPKTYQISNNQFERTYSFCPNAVCHYILIKLPEDLTRFQCPQCQRSFCLLCQSNSHQGIQCKQNRRNQRINQINWINKSYPSRSQRQFNQRIYFQEQSISFEKKGDFKLGFKFKQCPNCKFWTECRNNHDIITICLLCDYILCLECGDNFQQCPCLKQRKEQEIQRTRQIRGSQIRSFKLLYQNYPLKKQISETQNTQAWNRGYR